MRGDSKALMDHLRGYWARVEEVRRRGVRPGVFEEAHAVAYYLESSLDGMCCLGWILSCGLLS